MSRRVIRSSAGPVRTRRRWPAVVGSAAFALSTLTFVGSVQAVHDEGLFELDFRTAPTPLGLANVTDDGKTGASGGDDWDKVFAGTSGAFSTVFVEDGYRTTVPNADPARVEDTFFTGGGSKDTSGIQDGPWQYDTINDQVPDSDDIVDAFAAAYTDPADGHTIFYFGADRLDWDGDKQIGFWFFRQPVGLGPTGPQGTGSFTGQHRDGDTLVLADFRNGGQAGEVTVYRWSGDDATGQLVEIADKQQADCSVAVGAHDFCAVVSNTTGENPPWDYRNKDGGATYGAPGETDPKKFAGALFEGGIDMNAILGGDIGCFSTFLAETRSAHSETSQLKDFALGDFPVCGIDVVKSGDELSKIGDPANYTITVTNTGRATLYESSITDTLLGDLMDPANPLVTSNDCGASLAPDQSCTITATRTVEAGDPDPLPNTVSVLYTEQQDDLGLEFTASDDHSVNLFQPAVMIEKTGDGLSKAGDDVTYTFTITNKSSDDSPDLTLATITDDVIGDLSAEAGAAGCDVLSDDEVCSFTITRAVEAGDPDPLVNTVDVLYHPVGFPNDITARDRHSVNLFQPSVSITKSGDALSKISDDVTYHVEITNTSSPDSPNLVLDTIVDDVLGDLSDEAPAACDSLAPGATCTFDVPWTVAPGSPDPVINTVVVHFHPDGFPNDITATASHELNLFQPSIGFGKTADTGLSKVGDVVNYTIALNNTSSADSPSLVCTVRDPLLGIDKQVTLASGQGDVIEVAHTVGAGDPDPLVNTASATCSPTGFPNVLTATSSWTVELFQPSIVVDKSGDALSKVGDAVTYTFTITNTSSADSPKLKLDSVSDDVLGNLAGYANDAGCASLAAGSSCTFAVPWTVTAVDVNPVDGQADDPIVNTVVVHYHPTGFPNDITDADDHTLNLFRPAIRLDKTGDALSKIGDAVDYVITLYNDSSADSPDLTCTVTDALVGVNETFSVASGATHVINVDDFVIPAGAADPFPNTANASCSPAGFPNVLTTADSHTINLFQPAIVVEKTGDVYSKVGDTVTYDVTITNTSSDDTPAMGLVSFDDTLVPGIDPPAACDTLASGDSCSFDYTYTVTAGDDSGQVGATLTNSAQAVYNPAGFPNQISDDDTHDVTLLHPSFTLAKACASTEPVPQQGPAVFEVTVVNTGDADLVITLGDGIGATTLLIGETKQFDVSVPGPFTGQASVSNTVTADAVLAAKYGLPNTYHQEASGTCRIGSRVDLRKLTQGQVNPAQTWTFNLYGGPDGFGGTVLASDTTSGDADGILHFEVAGQPVNLDPSRTYTICELSVPSGWTAEWKIDTNGDGVVDTVVPVYNPDANDPVPQDVGNRCFDFGAGTAYALTAGGTLVFEVDNRFPGGAPRTPGYWKNWNRCTGGGQAANADRNGGRAAGFTLLEDILNNPGIVWDDILVDTLIVAITSCEEAVEILDQRVVLVNGKVADGKKLASDGARTLAMHLLAAQLNEANGACINQDIKDVMLKAETLLDRINFDGTKTTVYLKSGQADYATALRYAAYLDAYNNSSCDFATLPPKP